MLETHITRGIFTNYGKGGHSEGVVEVVSFWYSSFRSLCFRTGFLGSPSRDFRGVTYVKGFLRLFLLS